MIDQSVYNAVLAHHEDGATDRAARHGEMVWADDGTVVVIHDNDGDEIARYGVRGDGDDGYTVS